MNQTDVLLRIVEMAKVGGALPPYEAMCVIAATIDHLDRYSDSYELNVEALMRTGATIWTLASGSGGSDDPTWVPPLLRPDR